MKFEEKSPVAAWQAVTLHLNKTGKEAYNLLVTFDADSADEAHMLDFDPRSLGNAYDRIRDVANTIFPARTRLNSKDRAAFYQRYHRAHERGKTKAWGTYFGRFIKFGAKEINQLEDVIHALNTWKLSYRAALIMHASSAETDPLKVLGSPCLQYVQFNCPDSSRVNLLAVYRNHDYCNKALGNFFGLSRLLKFVCDETKREAGTVTCLSIHAYYENSTKSQNKLARLA